jgi:hypothetical protein
MDATNWVLRVPLSNAAVSYEWSNRSSGRSVMILFGHHVTPNECSEYFVA